MTWHHALGVLSGLCLAGTALAEPREPSLGRDRDERTSDDADAGPPAPPARYQLGEPYWYGWQILITDGAALAAVLSSGDRDWQAWSALAIYGLGGPVVHSVHGRGGAALGSLGLRAAGAVGALGTFVLVGCNNDWDSVNQEEESDCSDALAAGLTVAVLAGLLDASLLSEGREHLPVRRPNVSLQVSPRRGGSMVGAKVDF